MEEEEINIFGILIIGGIVFATKQGDLPYKSVLLNIDRVTVMKDLICQIIGGHTCNKFIYYKPQDICKKKEMEYNFCTCIFNILNFDHL